ncbi:Pol, partial [Symbiodinium necroappetens]
NERKVMEEYSRDLFGTGLDFVTGRGTEEAICKALTHVDEARARAQQSQRHAGRGHRGLKLRGSMTLSADMSKAFDMADRRRLRESLELAAADPFLIDLVGKLHVEALYEMTASDQAFSVATHRGIKQGCKLAPSLFAFATFLLFRKLGEHCDIEALREILTMYADDTLLQKHFDDLPQMQEALRLCDLLLDQLTELGFKVNPEKSALLLQLHGGSAQQVTNQLVVTKKGAKYVQLPSGRLIALKTQVPYLGIIISYHDYEMQSLRHRLQASKAVMKEVAHAVRNSHAITEKRRLSIWRITAWASALYGLHVVGLTEQGLAALESHMIYQLRFVLRSYSHLTHESNLHFIRRRGFKTAKFQVLQRLQKFLKRQKKGDKEVLLPLYLPRAERLAELIPQLSAAGNSGTDRQDPSQVCTECGAIFIGFWLLANRRNHCYANSVLQAKCLVTLEEILPSGGAPPPKGQGKGKMVGQRRKDGRSAGSEESELVTAMAKLALRHDEHMTALDLCYVSYVRTDAHSVLPELYAESKRQKSLMVDQSDTMQQKVKHEGILSSQGDWRYLEWSPESQSMVETLEDPLSTSQLLAGIGDVLSRLEADTTHVTMFKASRPITERMVGGPVRLLFSFPE